jgi:Ca2+-binding EF-hand superfamily protein
VTALCSRLLFSRDIQFVQLADILGMKITKEQAVNTIKEIDIDESGSFSLTKQIISYSTYSKILSINGLSIKSTRTARRFFLGQLRTHVILTSSLGTVDFDEFWDWWTSPSAKDTAAATLANELRGRMLKFKTTSILADTFGPMFGIVLPADFSAKQLLKSSFKSLSHTTTGTPLESKKKKRIRQVFEQFDKDGNGHIDHDEFNELCAKLGENMSQEEIDRTLDQIDADRNGTIEFEEFCMFANHDTTS